MSWQPSVSDAWNSNLSINEQHRRLRDRVESNNLMKRHFEMLTEYGGDNANQGLASNRRLQLDGARR